MHRLGPRCRVSFRRSLPVLIAVAAVNLAACDRHAPDAGDYMLADQNSGLLIQITSNRDGIVAGQLTSAVVDAKGKVTSTTVPITGTDHDGSLNLVARNGTGLFSTAAQITGTLSNNEMRLTLIGNGNAVPMTLKRADPSDFPKLVEKLSARSAEVRTSIAVADSERQAARSLSDQQSQTDRLTEVLKSQTTRLLAAPSKIQETIARYGRARSRIDALTAMRAKVAPGSASAEERTSDINEAIQDVIRQAGDIHGNVHDGRSSIERDHRENAGRVSVSLVACEGNPALSCDALKSESARNQAAYEAVISATDGEDQSFAKLIPASGG